MCMSFFCMNICAPLACLVFAETRIEHQTPWNELQLEANMLVLRLELGPLEERQVFLTSEWAVSPALTWLSSLLYPLVYLFEEGSHCVALAGLELTLNSQRSASWRLGLKLCSSIPGFNLTLKYTIVVASSIVTMFCGSCLKFQNIYHQMGILFLSSPWQPRVCCPWISLFSMCQVIDSHCMRAFVCSGLLMLKCVSALHSFLYSLHG